ncbi:MAG: potassium channel protein [Ilumatobacter fluminis]|uniref:potassium channel family protein n=1 Tax=Ilumatobacter fluminis TaxID=467091 RepID=UPI0032EBC2AE
MAHDDRRDEHHHLHRPRTPIARVLTGLAAFAVVIVIGIIGYVAAGSSPGDAFYMVIITIFGVGYGEVVPVDSDGLRALTITVIVAGYGAVLYTVGGFLQMLVDGELNQHFGARRMHRDIDRLSGHTIICGYGRMGASLAHDLALAGAAFVAIDSRPVTFDSRSDRRLSIVGDATEESVLEEAGIHRAAVLATVLSDDATNVFVTLTARAMNPDLTIIARGEQPATADKLRRCGADQVVLPTTIGAAKMSQLITRPTADQILARLEGAGDDNVDFAHLGLGLAEVAIVENSPLIGRILDDVDVRGTHEHLVVGLRRADGTTELHPPPTTTVAAGDTLVVVGYENDRPSLVRRTSNTSDITYRGAKSR